MHCDRTQMARIVDLSQTGHPDSVKTEVLRFICGINGPRASAVTRKQIGRWLARTPAEAVTNALAALVTERKVLIAGKRYVADPNALPPGYR